MKGLTGGIVAECEKANSLALNKAADGRITSEKERDVLFVPYYAWANRGTGEMAVWLPPIIR